MTCVLNSEEALTSHAVRCFKERCEGLGINLTIAEQRVVTEAAKCFLVKGVKIGGVYEHWKGQLYEVTEINRDSEDWSRFRVSYRSTVDPSHKASRFLDDFLGVHENGKIRFRLLF